MEQAMRRVHARQSKRCCIPLATFLPLLRCMKSAQWFVGCGWYAFAQHKRRHSIEFWCDASCGGVAAFNERQRNREAAVKNK